MRRLIFAVLTCSLITAASLSAQSGSMRVTVPSPTAASLGKFGDIPVSLYSGTPDISIKLFTAQGLTLALPIVLRYHAGGIRVEERGSWVGLGWALEAGGTITRTVRGTPDEDPLGGYYATGNVFYDATNWPEPPFALLTNMRQEDLDGEPDQFFFNFASRSGQFIMGPTTTSSTDGREVRTIPHQRIRIEPEFGGAFILSFTITTEDGTKYIFDRMEETTDRSLTSPAAHKTQFGKRHASSWHLTEIRAPGGDVITLHYSMYTVRHRMATLPETFAVLAQTSPNACPNNSSIIPEHEIRAQRLDSIKTAAHTIHFTADPALRQDALSPSGARQEPRLERMTVTTPTGTVLRVFRFEHDYLAGGRMRLRNLYEEDRNGVALPPYSFTYNGTALPAHTSAAQDHWGFFNGQTNNSSLVPRTVMPSGFVLPGANREPSASHLQAGILTRITYPTGGFNDFVYEPNDYGGIGPAATMPKGEGPTVLASLWWEWGLHDVDTTFTVVGPEPVVATVRVMVDPTDCEPGARDGGCATARIVGVGTWQGPQQTELITLQPGTYTMTFSSLNPELTGTFSVSWSTIVDMKVKGAGGLRIAAVHAVDGMGQTTTRRYRYRLESDPLRSSGLIGGEPDYDFDYLTAQCHYYSRSAVSKLPLGAGTRGQVAYREVTVLHGDTGEFGRTRHVFRSIMNAADSPMEPPSLLWPHLRWTSRDFMRGQEIEVRDDNAAGQRQQRVSTSHTFFGGADVTFRGMAVHMVSDQTADAFGQTGWTYQYNAFEVFSAWTFVDGETTIHYNESGTDSVATSRTYSYGNPAHLQLTQITETNSDGTQRITRMKYPADYPLGSGDLEASALSAMQGTAHIHNAVIERWVLEKTGGVERIVRGELTTFRQVPTGAYVPYQRYVLSSPTPLQ